MRLSEARRILSEAGVPDSDFDAREIFSELGGFSRLELTLSDVETDDARVIGAISRRASREPLAYILGYAYFYRERYEVNESCLVPRSDTELLVDLAVKLLPEGARFADLCTGSGCVGISVLANTKNTSAILADISESALALASRNAESVGVSDRAELILADVKAGAVSDKLYAVLSNPPYVKDGVYEGLDSEIFFEPKIAFVGGEDGMDFYRAITPIYRDVIDDGGFIAYEIGYDQGELITAVARECGMSCEIIRDLSGNERVALLKRIH